MRLRLYTLCRGGNGILDFGFVLECHPERSEGSNESGSLMRMRFFASLRMTYYLWILDCGMKELNYILQRHFRN
jgi:hypothetical protein